LALHGGAIADLAAGHSLIATLRNNGVRRLFAADWRTATQNMRFLGIDDYLADLNVLVDYAGGPVDLIGLCQGGWSATFEQLVRIGDGIVPGRKVLKFWGVESALTEDIRQVLQTNCAYGSSEFAAPEASFRNWYARTLVLPGRYFLEVVDKLYKHNELALGKFVSLGRGIDLAGVARPDLSARSR